MKDEKDYSENLHQGAKASTFHNARFLRRRQTKAEMILWDYLRKRRLNGHKFRRQHAKMNYVLDFYCHKSGLAIELDGGIHSKKANQQYDAVRTLDLDGIQIRVLRFTNDDVIGNIAKVLDRILEHLP